MTLLWAIPMTMYRRGWEFQTYGVLHAFDRIRDYRHTGEYVGYQVGFGFVPSVLISIAATAAAIWLYCHLLNHHWWRKPGHCVACGYDLQGSVSESCPECGEVHMREGSVDSKLST